MPKIPAKSRVDIEKDRLRNLHAKKHAQPGGLRWIHVLITFIVFTVFGVATLYAKKPILMWWVVGIGNTVLFFQILYLVVRSATSRSR